MQRGVSAIAELLVLLVDVQIVCDTPERYAVRLLQNSERTTVDSIKFTTTGRHGMTRLLLVGCRMPRSTVTDAVDDLWCSLSPSLLQSVDWLGCADSVA